MGGAQSKQGCWHSYVPACHHHSRCSPVRGLEPEHESLQNHGIQRNERIQSGLLNPRCLRALRLDRLHGVLVARQPPAVVFQRMWSSPSSTPSRLPISSSLTTDITTTTTTTLKIAKLSYDVFRTLYHQRSFLRPSFRQHRFLAMIANEDSDSSDSDDSTSPGTDRK